MGVRMISNHDGPSESKEEKITRLLLTELHPFKGYPALRGIMPRNQPYLVRDDDPTMIQLVARVKERGVTYPGVVRPDPEGGVALKGVQVCERQTHHSLILLRGMGFRRRGLKRVNLITQSMLPPPIGKGRSKTERP